MNHSPIIFFDGICNLCNAAVQFVIAHDRKVVFRFAPLQSPVAERFLGKSELQNLSSIALLMDGKIYRKSSAALKTAQQLGGAWKLFYVFMIIPSPIRDWLYDRIARNRYRWFGKRKECMVPTESVKKRFL